MNKQRRLARRWMAWISFWVVILAALALIYGLVLSPARLDVATAVADASAVFNGVLTALTSIVLWYIGNSTAERIFKKEESDADTAGPT